MPKLIAIVRIDCVKNPTRANWAPVLYAEGFQLVDRSIPYPDRNLKSSATFVGTLDEAWKLIETQDHGIRMGPPGAASGNYIYRKDLGAVWR